jgi:ribosomal protein L18
MVNARVQGLSLADSLNNTKRQGLASDLGAAITAGTPQFQYAQLASNNPGKDLLAAMTSRSNAAGYTTALGQNTVNNAVTAATDPAKSAASTVPDPNAGLTGAQTGLDSLSKFLQTDTAKGLGTKIGSLFGSGNQLVFPPAQPGIGATTPVDIHD